MQIIDLDELLGADKKVRLGGKIWTLPPDLPVELYLKITALAQRDVSEAEMVEALYDSLLELFRYKDPKLSSLPLSMSHLVTAVARIYGTPEEEETTQLPPPRKAAGGPARTGPKSKPRTRSRR